MSIEINECKSSKKKGWIGVYGNHMITANELMLFCMLYVDLSENLEFRSCKDEDAQNDDKIRWDFENLSIALKAIIHGICHYSLDKTTMCLLPLDRGYNS